MAFSIASDSLRAQSRHNSGPYRTIECAPVDHLQVLANPLKPILCKYLRAGEWAKHVSNRAGRKASSATVNASQPTTA